MKKILLTGALSLLSLLTVSAKDTAPTYSYFCVKQLDGAEMALPVDNLSITFADGVMTAVSTNGTNSFDLTNVQSFYFTDSTSGVALTASDANGRVSVWNVNGTSCGDFDSVKAAAASLHKGVYVIKYSNGGTVKIELK
jgi:hypothetical protein